MKKVFCCFFVVILSFTLCCCKTKHEILKEPGKPLSDGTDTYYINELDDNKNVIYKTRYNSQDRVIEEYEYNYSFDINGRLYRIKETDVLNGNYNELFFNKYNQKTEKVFYNKEGIITEKYYYLKNGNIKKKYIYKSGNENGYILYDYYTDNNLKNETEYSENGKAVKITTYYKNKKIYQIKEFDKSGFIDRITKYLYKKEKLIKESVYNKDFNLIQVTDYTKNPKEIIRYDKEKTE